MVVYLAFQIIVVRWILKKVYKRLSDQGKETDINFIVCLFFDLLLSAWVAEIIGVHAFFGAFFFGLMLPKDGELTEFLGPRVELLIVNVFVPLYFTYSVLNTNLRELGNPSIVFAALFFTIVCTFAKATPVLLIAHYRFKYDWHESISMAFLIQARGLVSLITANVGHQAGIFNSKSFSVIILVTILTMCMASPVFYSIYEKYLIDRYAQLEEGEHQSSSKAEAESVHSEKHDETGDRLQSQLDYEKEKDIGVTHEREESVAGEDETPTPTKQLSSKKIPTRQASSSNVTNERTKLDGMKQTYSDADLLSDSGRSTPRRKDVAFRVSRPDDW